MAGIETGDVAAARAPAARKVKKTLANTSEQDLAAYFDYLDVLRESGITNMYGARPYLAKAFKLKDQDYATSVLSAWMRTFSRTASPDDRARAAIAKAEGK